MLTLINVDVTVLPDRTGRAVVVPGLRSDDGVVLPLVWYAEAKQKEYSMSTLTKIREAFRLFFEYSAANDPGATFGAERPSGVKTWEHFARFRGALLDGTFDVRTGLDPSDLGWRPSSLAKVNQVVRYLTNYFLWADEHGATAAKRFNPHASASPRDELMQRAAYEYKRSKAFLGHTWARAEQISIEGRAVGRVKEYRKHTKEPVRFRDDLFGRLLLQGFTLRSPSNLRDILITILLNKGGLRESEPMHLYVSDVTYDPATNGALVVVRHPSVGAAPPGRSGVVYTNRQDFLARQLSMLPRNMVTGPLHAGWKSPFDEIEVLWFQPVWGRAFWALWQRYLAHIAPLRRNHPFAFVALDGPTVGEPLKLDAFNKSHRSAVYRAGLVSDGGVVDLKSLGLSPHGHRHAYAHRAKNRAKLPPVMVQRMLNHGSIESQEVYTRLSSREAQRVLEDGSKRMHGTVAADDLVVAALLSIETDSGPALHDEEG